MSVRRFVCLNLLFSFVVLAAVEVHAARLKDIANIRGVRANQLVGYGIVVGLAGTGDSKSEFTNKSIGRMLDRLGVKVSGEDISSQNVAAVIVTATLPAFARSGNKLDVTVSSLGDAKSLRGGTLIQTPLRAADQQIYAVAQGPLLVGQTGGSGVHEAVGRIPDGAMIERDLGQDFASRKMFRLTLQNPDFTTAARVVTIVNKELSGKYATALDAGTVDIIAPPNYEGKGVELLATIERLEINPDQAARVVVNEKTGTVVIGHQVKVSQVALSHGDLSLKVNNQADDDGDRVVVLKESANVGDLVDAMNKLGVSPKDLIAILQSIKAAGALHGELEIL